MSLSTKETKREKREAKRRRREERRRIEARIRYTKAQPLRLPGSITLVAEVESRARRLREPLTRLVAMIPTEPTSTSARARTREARVAAGLIGVALALFGGSPPVVFCGCLLLILASALPMSASTQMRWRRRAQRVGLRRGRATTHAIEVVYDGRGVSVVLDGKNFRRVRNAQLDTPFVIRAVSGGVALGLLPRKGRRSGELWLVAQDAPSGTLAAEADREHDAALIDTPVSMSEPDLLRLHEAIRSDDTPSLVDP